MGSFFLCLCRGCFHLRSCSSENWDYAHNKLSFREGENREQGNWELRNIFLGSSGKNINASRQVEIKKHSSRQINDFCETWDRNMLLVNNPKEQRNIGTAILDGTVLSLKLMCPLLPQVRYRLYLQFDDFGPTHIT